MELEGRIITRTEKRFLPIKRARQCVQLGLLRHVSAGDILSFVADFLSLNLWLDAAGKSLRKQREREGTSTRKLIGHSGPVYSISFDPVAGSAGPPRHLLSASADGTARLWSLETFNALVAYRGHQHPVWDVEWGPLGTYFATASADRTARLWSSERINPLRIYAGHLSDVDVSEEEVIGRGQRCSYSLE